MAALWYRCGCHWHGRLVEMLQTLRPLIVDDEPLAIERLQNLAGQQDGIALVGTASDGASALRMVDALAPDLRSEEPTSELQSIMRTSYAGFCLQKNKHPYSHNNIYI